MLLHLQQHSAVCHRYPRYHYITYVVVMIDIVLWVSFFLNWFSFTEFLEGGPGLCIKNIWGLLMPVYAG